MVIKRCRMPSISSSTRISQVRSVVSTVRSASLLDWKACFSCCRSAVSRTIMCVMAHVPFPFRSRAMIKLTVESYITVKETVYPRFYGWLLIWHGSR